MTNYEYTKKMQDLALRMVKVLKAKGEPGISRFYQAAANDFGFRMDAMSKKEASIPVDEDREFFCNSYETKVMAYEREIRA